MGSIASWTMRPTRVIPVDQSAEPEPGFDHSLMEAGVIRNMGYGIWGMGYTIWGNTDHHTGRKNGRFRITYFN